MNDVFSIKRFSLLVKKTITERPMQTVGIIVLLLIFSLILYVAAKEIAGFGAAQNLTFIWGLAGGSFFLSSFIFNYFSTNASGSSYLTLPVSYFEKWLCGILIAGILYPLLFLLVYHLLDTSFVAAYQRSLDPTSLFYKQQSEGIYPFDLNGRIAWRVYAIFFLFTGAMLTGSLYFNKSALIKTGITLCVAFFILFGLNWLIATMLFGKVNDANLYNHVTLQVGKEEGVLLLPPTIQNIFLYSTSYIIPAILWFLPLLRLREKEF